MDERALLQRLHELLVDASARFGEEVDPIDPDTCPPDMEVYPVGRSGVVALIGGYLLAAWPPDERNEASPAAMRYIRGWLEARGQIRHMVFWRNAPSIIATRRLGAEPIGVDPDGYIHYITTLEDFNTRELGSIRAQNKRAGDRTDNGQEVAASQGP